MNARKTSIVKRTILSLYWLIFLTLAPMCTFAQTSATSGGTPTPVPPVPNPCSRFTAGRVVHNPPALFSSNGVLNVRFSYQQTTDSAGRTLFCFMTDTGLEEPTLHVKPGCGSAVLMAINVVAWTVPARPRALEWCAQRNP